VIYRGINPQKKDSNCFRLHSVHFTDFLSLPIQKRREITMQKTWRILAFAAFGIASVGGATAFLAALKKPQPPEPPCLP
jgi:hypothetical protein